MPLASRFRRWRIWSNHSGPTARPNSSKRIGAFGTVTYKKHKALLLVCPVFFLGGGKGIAEDGGRLNACLPICAEWPPGSEVSDIGITTCPTGPAATIKLGPETRIPAPDSAVWRPERRRGSGPGATHRGTPVRPR